MPARAVPPLASGVRPTGRGGQEAGAVAAAVLAGGHRGLPFSGATLGCSSCPLEMLGKEGLATNSIKLNSEEKIPAVWPSSSSPKIHKKQANQRQVTAVQFFPFLMILDFSTSPQS